MRLPHKLRENFFETTRVLLRYSSVLLLLFLLARIVEYLITPVKGLFPHTLLHVLENDIIFTVIPFGYFFIPAFLLMLLAPTFTRVLLLILYLLIFIIHICLLTYFRSEEHT